jgi:protein TonB
VDEEPVVEEIFDVVEEAPEFPGGMAEMYSFLGEEIKYPQMAQDNNIQGKVYVQFVVEKDGSITDVTVIKGVHASTLDKEAVRVVSEMPNWKPGKQRGKAVRVRYTIPINFTIN